jgi:7-alpha-hydroxysteroid dehydrogenase
MMPNAFRLDERVAVVTGAGRGIGAAIATAYAEAGADIVLVARTREQVATTAERVRASGRRAVAVPCDITNLAALPLVVERTIAELGRLDLEEAFHFNVTASFELIKQAVPHLLASGQGSIINVTSVFGRVAGRGLLVYGTVKAALAQMTRLLAADLSPRVRVNAIAPGVIETDALKAALTNQTRSRAVAATPLRRLGTVEDVAAAAVWLASPAASYLTGKVIEVDGGAEGPTLRNELPDL